VWYKSSYAGGWTLATTVPATDLTADITVPHWLTDIDIAIRTTLGGVGGSGYTASDPSVWPAVSRGTINSGGEIQSLTPDVWDRQSATRPAWQLALVGAGMGVTAHAELTATIEYSSDGGGSWHSATGAFVAGSSFLRVEHTNGDVNVSTYRYRVVLVGPGASSAQFTTTDRLFEPEAPSGVSFDPDQGGFAGGHIHRVYGSTVDTALSIEAKARHLPAGTMTGYATMAGGFVDLNVVGGVGVGTPGVDDGDLEVTVRSFITLWTVTDRSTPVVMSGADS
jgi:hypothetical protein